MNYYSDLFDAVDAMFGLDKQSTTHYSTPSFPKSNVVIEEDGTMRFEFALAGYKKEDLKVDFDENRLILSTVEDFKAPEVSENEKVLANNIKKTSFNYSYRIPEVKYKFAETKATFENGILTIKVPPVEKKERPTIVIA